MHPTFIVRATILELENNCSLKVVIKVLHRKLKRDLSTAINQTSEKLLFISY